MKHNVKKAFHTYSSLAVPLVLIDDLLGEPSESELDCLMLVFFWELGEAFGETLWIPPFDVSAEINL